MNNEISVIMSVFNESIKDIEKSIDSILCQTYIFFELIIVNDNPDRKELVSFLAEKAKGDNRISILTNKKNIGLAMSLNRAIKYSKNEILMRMDADDVSVENRMQVEVNELILKKSDLVFSNYYLIDENDNIIGKNDQEIVDVNYELIVSNIIHHPTVMYKKSSVLRAGGYRDYPCSQDYDLWLRMMENKAVFTHVNQRLLLYRIRKASISNAKALKQVVTLCYIKNLFIERKTKKRDSYSYENYNKYIMSFGEEVNDTVKALQIRRELDRAAEYKNKRKPIRTLLIKCRILASSKCYRAYFISKIKSKLFIVKYRKRGA